MHCEDACAWVVWNHPLPLTADVDAVYSTESSIAMRALPQPSGVRIALDDVGHLLPLLIPLLVDGAEQLVDDGESPAVIG